MTNPNTHAELLNTPDPAETLDGDVLRAEPEESFAPRGEPIWYDPASDPDYDYNPEHPYGQGHDRDHDRWGHDRWRHDRDHWGHHRDHGGHHHDRDHDGDHWGRHHDHDHRGHHDRDHDGDDWGHHRDHDHRDRWEHDGDHGQHHGPVYQNEPAHDYNYTAPAEDGDIHIDPIESHPIGEDVVIEPEPIQEPAPEPETAMTEEPEAEAHADVMPIA